jgi:hypothetical protein
MSYRSLWHLVIVGILSSLTMYVASPLAAHELTQSLSPEEVVCNERQLEKILKRMRAGKETYVTPQLPTNLLVSYSNSSGFYEGLVATYQGFRLGPGEIPPTRSDEHYLAFNVNPSIRTLLLNPRRLPLAQVSLNREQSSSNLVAPGSYFELSLTLDPSLGGGDPLVINNLLEPALGEPYDGFIANSTKPGRGLVVDGLLTPCHEKFSRFDRHVFSILQRIVRANGFNEFFNPDMEIAIFRGEDPHTFRLAVYPIHEFFEERGRMAVELRIAWTSGGKLTTAEMRALPACAVAGQIGCSALNQSSPLAFLIPPVFGGHELYDNSAVGNGVFFLWNEGPSSPVTINLESLLSGTTWNDPVW